MTKTAPYANAVGADHAFDLSERIAEMLRAELPALDRAIDQRCVAATALAVAAQRLDRIAETGAGKTAKWDGVTACLACIGAGWLAGLLR